MNEIAWKLLCRRRWLLPAYNMPANAGHQKLLRAVVRSDLNIELAKDLVDKVKQVVEWCVPLPSPAFQTREPAVLKQVHCALVMGYVRTEPDTNAEVYPISNPTPNAGWTGTTTSRPTRWTS